MRVVCATIIAALACLAAGVAGGALTPSAQEAAAKALLAQIGAPDLAYAPTRVPPNYVYASYSVTGNPQGLDVSFANKRFDANVEQTALHEISFDTSYLSNGEQSCGDAAHQTLRLSGITIYANGRVVWRCVRTIRGRTVRESATGFVPQSDLTLVLMSARPF